MSPRSFWKILLKLSGLWIFFDSLPVLMQTIMNVFSSLQNEPGRLIFTSAYGIISFAIVFGISYLLIYQSDMVIEKLKLHEGFEENIFSINMHRSTIVTIAVIILGGWMFVDSLPHICQQLYPLFSKRTDLYTGVSSDYSWLVFYAAKLFAGLLMMIYCRDIVNFIDAKRKRSGSTLMIDPSEEKES